MTQKKPRTIIPYTVNLTSVSLGGFESSLIKLIGKYSDDDPKLISDRLHRAVGRYYEAINLNPNRQVREKQSADRHELLESIKEVNLRLNFVVHIPPVLMAAARAAYVAHPCGKSSLDDEIRDLLPRLRHVGSVFESAGIPKKTTTNPGKLEHRALDAEIDEIFDKATKRAYKGRERERLRDRKRFRVDVVATFNDLRPSTDKRPRQKRASAKARPSDSRHEESV